MHRFTLASFLVMLMPSLSWVFGNPVDNTAADMTNPKLYRRKAKELKLKITHSEFREKWEKPFFTPVECPVDSFKRLYPPGSKNLFSNETRNAQGVYFEDEKQWYHQAKLQNYPKIDGCYEPANGPQTMNGIDLKPFTSIVTKSYDKDTKLFIKELEGRKVDNGAEHNGCVQVVDNDTEDSDLGMYISTAERKEKYFKDLDMVTVTEKDDCDVRRYKLE